MYTQAYEIFSKVGNDSAEALRQATDLNQKAGDKLVEMRAGWAQQAVKFAVGQVELFAKAQDPRSYLSAQAALVGDYLETGIKNSQELASVLTDSTTEAREWVEQGVVQAQANLKEVAEKKAA